MSSSDEYVPSDDDARRRPPKRGREDAPSAAAVAAAAAVESADGGGGRRAKRRRAKSQPAPRSRRKQLTLEQTKAEMGKIRRLRGRGSLTHAAVTDILHGYRALQLEALEYKRKTGKSKAANAQNRISRILGYSNKTVANVMATWNARDDDSATGLYQATNRGNHSSKTKRIPLTKRNVILTREFVRKARKELRHVTATQVLEYFVDQGVIEVPSVGGVWDKQAYAAANRAVRRFLNRVGYLRGKRKDHKLQLMDSIKDAQVLYIDALMKNRARPPDQQLREVYLGESYVHHHHYKGRHNDLYDPSDELDDHPTKKAQQKGRRYCILAAIQGPNPRTAGRPGPADLAGVVPGSRWVFCPQQAKAKAKKAEKAAAAAAAAASSSSAAASSSSAALESLIAVTKSDPHTGDYHKNFNGNNFAHWWKTQLLPNLKEPSIIIMDNASYHLTPPPGKKPLSKLLKQEIIDELTQRGVEHNPSDLKPVLVAKLRPLYDNDDPYVVQLAKEQGHRVLFTPKYHSDLQPIELVWAHIKGNVARQYSKATTFADVLERLTAQFEELEQDKGQHRQDGKTRVQAMIDKTNRVVTRFYVEDCAEDKEQEGELDGADADVNKQGPQDGAGGDADEEEEDDDDVDNLSDSEFSEVSDLSSDSE